MSAPPDGRHVSLKTMPISGRILLSMVRRLEQTAGTEVGTEVESFLIVLQYTF